MNSRRLKALSSSNTTTTNQNFSTSHPMRILYIVTSGGKSYSAGIDSRFVNSVIPVLLETTHSLTSNPKWQVDLYLVLGFALDNQTETQLRETLPFGVGLQVWSEARPAGYLCNPWSSTPSDPVGQGKECSNAKGKTGPAEQAALKQGNTQLARQHRYVVKDKLPFYDFFVVFEDDMVVKRHHVEMHMDWMARLTQWKQQAASSTPDGKSWTDALSRNQWNRMRPGFLRAEVLQQNNKIQKQQQIYVNVTNTTRGGNHNSLDASLCCQMNHSIPGNKWPSIRPLQASDLMVWETSALGMGVRNLPRGTFAVPSDATDGTAQPETYPVALLTGPSSGKEIPSFWTGDSQNPKPGKPSTTDPKFLAQSAGWMASSREVMALHQNHCRGGFLPPFDVPTFQQDGFYRNNVEFWSGGIQLWCQSCNIQRFLSLENGHEFSKHLLYHSSNNKQNDRPPERQTLVPKIWNDLQATQAFLQRQQQ